jgi:hypothetical protein
MRVEQTISLKHLEKVPPQISTYNERKLIGAFYTPFDVSEILCNWAVRSSGNFILEPSFGGCNFLEAAKNRLISYGATEPSRKLFGCDIDQKAFGFLKEKIGIREKHRQFINEDFLKLKPSDFLNGKFDVIIGNPPYISLPNMSKKQKHYALSALEDYGYSLPPRSSLWAYFIVHSLNFLKRGGRMAWVLPGSLLFADYAKFLKKLLEKKFKRVLAVQVGMRLFLSKGSDESTIILLCDGFDEEETQSVMEFGFASTLNELEDLLSSWNSPTWKRKPCDSKPGLLLMDEVSRNFFEIVLSDQNTFTLGKFAKVSIGIVTGANAFFIINKSEAIKHNLPESGIKKILPKFHFCRGLTLTSEDIKNACDADERCFLVDTSNMKKDDILFHYIEKFPEKMKEKNRTFKKRALWHRPDDNKIPDAFYPYMHNVGPRLVLNKAGINCTNTIHRVFFQPGIEEHQKKLITISLITTFSQLSAEIEGRSYGSGVLKHEPGEAVNIKLFIPSGSKDKVNEINDVFSRIESHIRDNQLEDAREIADRFIFNKYVGSYGDIFINQLKTALMAARFRRKGKL